MAERVALDDLIFRRDLYPRQDIVEANVARMKQIRDSGQVLDAITACRETQVIIDGVHRWTEARRRGDPDIAVEWRDFTDDAERLRVATLLNANHGLRLTQHDRLRVIELADQVGLKDPDLADAMAVSVSYLRALKPRYATVSEAIEGSKKLRERRVPLKASVRHLSGQEISPEQETEIMGSAPGTSYLLAVRQLTRAANLDLLPPQSQHPALWVAMGELRTALDALLS